MVGRQFRVAMLASVLVCVSTAVLAQQQPAATQPSNEAERQAPTPAVKEPAFPTVSIGILSYLQYDAELRNREDFNAFDVTRGYINIVADVAKNVRFRATPDIRRVTDGSLTGSLAFRMKYAFAEFNDVLGTRSWVRFGLHQTPWLDFEESINRYRVQGQMFAEREGVIPGSGDFGAGVLVPLPGGRGEVNAGVYNGEGFGNSETNKFKSFQGRITVRPFPGAPLTRGLRISAFYDHGSYARDFPRRHGIVMASFEHPHFVGTVQWLAGTERTLTRSTDAYPRGASVFAEMREGLEGWAAFARVDRFNPDHNTRDLSDRRVIAGVAYWLTWAKSRVGFVLDDEDVRYEAGRNRPDENRLLFQTHIQF